MRLLRVRSDPSPFGRYSPASRAARSATRQAELDRLIETHERLRHLGREEHGGHYRCACPTGILIRDVLDTPVDSPFVVERRDGSLRFEGLATECW